MSKVLLVSVPRPSFLGAYIFNQCDSSVWTPSSSEDLSSMIKQSDVVILECNSKLEDMSINTSPAREVLYLVNTQGKKLIFLSSSQVYGEAVKATEKSEIKPLNPYALSQVLIERSITEISINKAMPCNNFIILRLTDVYGPPISAKVNHQRVAPMCIIDLVIKSLTVDQDYFYGIKDLYLAPLYIDNALDVIRKLIEDPTPRRDIFNFGGPDLMNEVSIASLVAEKLKISGKIIPITRYDLGITDEPMKNSVSCQHIYKKLSPKKRRGIVQGIQLICDNYINTKCKK